MKPNINSKEYTKAISVEKMRASDEFTIKNLVSSKELMHRAANAIYESTKWENKNILIVCGGGNNGGDGYALATILSDIRCNVSVCKLSDKFTEDSLHYHTIAKTKGIHIFEYTAESRFDRYDIIVDCIFGTGFSGNPRGVAGEAIEKINDSNSYVISADINSGLNGDSGEYTIAVKSDLTVSIGYYKKGMFKGTAPDLIGDLINADIGIVLV